MKLPWLVWAGSCLLLVAAAGAAPRVEGPELAVQLLAPTPTAPLPAGGSVELAWDFVASPPAGATEWEIYLSLDGGRSYPVRLTPHLDLTRRRVTVRLPATPSREARFLLRVGDEREEIGVELPGVFTLAAGPLGAPAVAPVPPALALTRGESARPGLLGVSRWVEGARDGSGWREVAARPLPVLDTTITPGSLELAVGWPPRRPDAESLGELHRATISVLPPVPAPRAPAEPEPKRPLLDLLRRLNR
ncbi:MAG: hypothetical protein SF066_14510 [Thermoanaerobaculia bacterium]|nr:hypothetical protein [Thermoanaerobaculia bacterium]